MSEGVTFGAYRVVRKLGQGGMGAVYLGEHGLIGRRAAIKVLHRERSVQRDHVERFFNEARATSAVADPGIVQIYDVGVTADGAAYLVMEYLDGESLRARLRRLRVLSPREAVRITRQVAGSLAAAHAAGIVHRDLKPENLFVVRDPEAPGGERAKILDFGIAKLAGDSSDRVRTRTGAVMGTPAYMSPEQCNDAGKIDHRTDIYSLGCVLFHLLVGRPPFDVAGVGAIIAAHIREPAPVPSEVAPHVPGVLDPLVARCLAKRRDDRFQTMHELQQACDALLGQLPADAPTATIAAAPAMIHGDEVTTLGNSAGEASRRGAPLRLGARLAIGAAAVVAGAILAVATTRSAPREADAALRSPAAAPAAPAALTVEPLPAPAPEIRAPAAPPSPVSPEAADPPAAPAPAAHPASKPAPRRHKPRRNLYEDRI